MTILCGVDFSEYSSVAARSAAALAELGRAKLILAHAAEDARGKDVSELVTSAERRLKRKAQRVRHRGVEVEAQVAHGAPEQVLLDAARARSASVVVVGARGLGTDGVSGLGAHADRLAREAHVPVLVARNAEPFEAWSRGERPLRILLGADLSVATRAAIRFVGELARMGPCEVTVAHCYWPPVEWTRLGLGGVRAFDVPDPEVTRALERELASATEELRATAKVRMRAEPNLGSIGQHLVRLAVEEAADLVVVGSRALSGLRRLWETSVSHTVLERAAVAVACVPSNEAEASDDEMVSASCVLVATDFTNIGVEAVRHAYAGASARTKVHLVHVTGRSSWDSVDRHDIFEDCPGAEALAGRLVSLVPDSATRRGVQTEVHVLNSENRAEAICQAAERLGADAIYLGTHGRGGITRAILGSVSQGVLARTQRRVVLVRPGLTTT